ncbi:Protein borderless [Frankliniella fusca]|uniref:Protein borderless n=1 Tax=Frankliniella fusca TaxID=407009 RepID=A0AAE1HWE9_9NEOP|nr:Protein borderless [Frankliniella fusca]
MWTWSRVAAAGYFNLEEESAPAQLKASVGDSVVFNCKLEFPNDVPIPYIMHWNKGGSTVFSWADGQLTAEEPYKGRVSPAHEHDGTEAFTGAVNLTSIRESDKGWYECRVHFPNRTPSTRLNGTWLFLDVDGGTLLATPPINKTTLEGETAHFSCVTKNRAHRVTWYKDGVPIPEIVELRQRSFVSPDGSLTIAPTAMGDPGEYMCEVTDGSTRQQASAHLDVQYKAKVMYSPREVQLPYGRSATLDCHFRANPPLTSLRWEKDGFLFDPYNVQGVFYRRNGSLYFSKASPRGALRRHRNRKCVDEIHRGRYTCTPFNDLGTEGPSPVIDVRVQRPPVFTITPHNMYLRRTGDSVAMPCDAVNGGDTERPLIVWFKKDGTPLPRSRITMEGGNLTLVDIVDEDRGMYQCVASNGAATISVETELVLENTAPRPPYNLRAVSSTTSVTLTWLPGVERPQTQHSVWFRISDSPQWHVLPDATDLDPSAPYRQSDTPEWRTLRVGDTESTEAMVSGLKAGREYEFMVLSQDEHGDGMFSKAIRVKTAGTSTVEEVPHEFRAAIGSFQQIGPPRNVTVRVTGEGFLVAWDPPAFGVEDLKHYVVRWARGAPDSGYLPSGTDVTNDLSYIIRYLEEDRLYSIFVLSVNSNDVEVTSHPVSLYVPPYRSQRALSVGMAVGLALVAAAVAAAWYLREKQIKRMQQRQDDEANNLPSSNGKDSGKG